MPVKFNENAAKYAANLGPVLTTSQALHEGGKCAAISVVCALASGVAWIGAYLLPFPGSKHLLQAGLLTAAILYAFKVLSIASQWRESQQTAANQAKLAATQKKLLGLPVPPPPKPAPPAKAVAAAPPSTPITPPTRANGAKLSLFDQLAGPTPSGAAPSSMGPPSTGRTFRSANRSCQPVFAAESPNMRTDVLVPLPYRRRSRCLVANGKSPHRLRPHSFCMSPAQPAILRACVR